MKVNYKEKEYTFEHGHWWSTNKNGDAYRVANTTTVANLHSAMNEQEIVQPSEDKQAEEQNEEGELTNKQTLKPAGLGDVISLVTKALGIEECDSCNKRKLNFNKIFNWLKPVRCLTDEEVIFVKSLASKKTTDAEERKKLFSLYNEITKSKLELCSCPGLCKRLIERLSAFIE